MFSVCISLCNFFVVSFVYLLEQFFVVVCFVYLLEQFFVVVCFVYLLEQLHNIVLSLGRQSYTCECTLKVWSMKILARSLHFDLFVFWLKCLTLITLLQCCHCLFSVYLYNSKSDWWNCSTLITLQFADFSDLIVIKLFWYRTSFRSSCYHGYTGPPSECSDHSSSTDHFKCTTNLQIRDILRRRNWKLKQIFGLEPSSVSLSPFEKVGGEKRANEKEEAN